MLPYQEIDDEELANRWKELLSWVRERFDRDAGIESILFLVGIQSRGQGYQPKLSKKAKQDLIMEGTYCVFETLGLYKRVGIDEKGHTIWANTNTLNQVLTLPEQEKLLQVAILTYFDTLNT